MTAVNCNVPVPHVLPEAPDLAPPAWVNPWAGTESTYHSASRDGLELWSAEGFRGTVLSVRLRKAVDAPPDELEARTIQIYRLVRSSLAASRHPWPARLWNYIPHIHGRMDADRDRYMVFNGGRFKEYCQWWGGPHKFPEHVPTASGIGHDGSDLVVHCLGTDRPGLAVENPRQIPAFGYSKRYGPLPPCFARATLLPAGKGHVLLLGGTASIVGEQSMHTDSLEDQTNETLANMAAVVQSAASRVNADVPDQASALSMFRSLRIYFPKQTTRDWCERNVTKRFSNAAQFEFIRADLCRQELLIEIEGVAELCMA